VKERIRGRSNGKIAGKEHGHLHDKGDSFRVDAKAMRFGKRISEGSVDTYRGPFKLKMTEVPARADLNLED
jgi:hypothetical protein